MDTEQSWADRVAEGVRVELARRRLDQSDLATALGRSRNYVSRRLNGHYPFKLDEIEAAADWLGVPLASLAAEVTR